MRPRAREVRPLASTHPGMATDRGPIRTALAIAGSDSGGGAGIQADLKAFARCGVHGTTAITAITAQSTTGVSSVHAVPPETIVDQVRAVAADIHVDAVKIGMLGTVETIAAVDEALDVLAAAADEREWGRSDDGAAEIDDPDGPTSAGAPPVVIDPVMVAESGAALLDDGAIEALKGLIAGRASVITPNVSEGRLLADAPGAEPPELARALHALGAPVAVVTGGHTRDGADLYFDGSQLVPIEGEVHPGAAAHGSGCTHSSALAAALARGAAPLEAARAARRIAAAAVRDGLQEIGAGAGPVDALGIRRQASEL
jgi:hydroxymethylpyrimidine/phosphomethylpyrimidine kinase